MNKHFDSALFEPQVILPPQVSWGARCDADTSGARALMLAILEDAVLCIERGRRRRHPGTRLLATDAEKWMRSDSREWLFSFVSICEALGIDPDAVRVRLVKNVEHPANGGRTVRAEADEPSIRSGAVVRLLPQGGGTRGPTAVDSIRTPARRTAGGWETEAGLAVRAHARVA
jgi:hypothetical protein